MTGRECVCVLRVLMPPLPPSPPAVHERVPADELLIIGCDGVWDVLSNEECVKEVRDRLTTADGVPVVESLLDLCLEKGSRDNMTACLVKLRPAGYASPPECVCGCVCLCLCEPEAFV